MGRFAVITAFTPDFYTDFKFFYDSLRRITKVPLFVLPVESDKKPHLPEAHLVDLPADKQTLYQGMGKRWVQWYKPSLIDFVMDKYKINTALWIDSDTVILDDLKPLFEKAEKDFFVMVDNFAPKGCLNDERLYDRHPAPCSESEAKISLNSGVIGISYPRDRELVQAWENKSLIVAGDEKTRDLITLYDQGTLLWTMRERKVMNKVIHRPPWNHNAIRNVYEQDQGLKWPFGPRHMGGDLFDQIKYDNPEAVIAHYAGVPKLSHLCEFDCELSKQYRYNVHKDVEPTRLFGVGLERAGTHSLAEILRRCSRYGSWVRHEHQPVLAFAAQNKWSGEPVDHKQLEDRFKIYNRTDVQFIAEVNHRLGFFIPEIKENVPNAKFVLMLRNPIDLVRSRLLNFSCWGNELSQYPLDYQFSMYGLHRDFAGAGSGEQNSARIRPEKHWRANPVERHVWEVVETLKYTLRDLHELESSDFEIIWLEDLKASITKLQRLIPKHYLYWGKAAGLTHTRFGASKKPEPKIADWVDTQVNQHSEFILQNIMDVLREYQIEPYRWEFV